ncbi:MAG: transglutaminase domain-containing protein, partial [Bacteroidetes bacterium]|nr:transglutaminase domain-containing protein [Bacteroidota bacterium]
EYTTVVYLAPVQFEVQNYNGTMGTWQDFGKFINNLKSNRDQLPDNIKQAVHQMTDGISDPKEKIARLYRYMQDNTHYVGIQLGIGGWQPFDANYVGTKKYGDCKALSNYMYALLKEAGLPSCYTLINAGRDNKFFLSDFPSAHFNHVILCVPLKTDTVWLECTSQTIPPGYLGGSTEDRPALLVNENGGTLVRTPVYSFKDNLEIRHTKAVADESGDLTVDVVTRYTGLQQDELHSMINSLTKEKVKQELAESVDLPQYDLLNYSYKEKPSALPEIMEALQLKAPGYAQVSGRRFFIAPNIMTKAHTRYIPDEERQHDVYTGYAYTDIDSTEIQLPAGYQPESLPAPVSIESKFGRYSASLKLDGNVLKYYRSVEKYSGRFPAAQYNDMVKFWQQIYKADRNKVVMVKKE